MNSWYPRTGDGYIRILKYFQLSRTGVRRIIKQFKERHRLQNKTNSGKKWKNSKTMERKLMNVVLKTLEQLPKFYQMTEPCLSVSKGTVTRILYRNRLHFCRGDSLKADRSMLRTSWRKMMHAGRVSILFILFRLLIFIIFAMFCLLYTQAFFRWYYL